MRALLAQRIAIEIIIKDAAPIVHRCVRALRTPWQDENRNHLVLPHQALAPLYVREAEQTAAAIYQFDDESMRAAETIRHSRRRCDLMMKIARSPASRCFFEFQAWDRPSGRNGIYVEGDHNHARFVSWVEDFEQRAGWIVPVMCAEFKLLGNEDWVAIRESQPACAGIRLRNAEKDTLESINLIVTLWTFLASQGACIIAREPAPRGSGKAYRSKGPGAAILSFNRVRLARPGIIARTNEIEWQRGPGVRRHQVRAHPAFYRIGSAGRHELVLRWIEAYWRGQERQGLVLKAYEVSRS